MSDIKRLHVIVTGKVQGVFFRAFTRDEAVRLGLSGWVRNRPNGSVEATIEGEATAVQKMLLWFQQGSPNSIVEKIETSDEPPAGGAGTFEIRY